MAESKAIATIGDDEVRAALLEGVEIATVDDPEAIAREIMARILEAESDDEVYGAFQATSGQEILGVPLMVYGVRWQRSSYTEGHPVYAVMDAVRSDTGERGPVTTSGGSIMAALLNFQKRGAWPQVLRLEAGKTNAKGYTPLRLVRMQKPETAPAGDVIEVEDADVQEVD